MKYLKEVWTNNKVFITDEWRDNLDLYVYSQSTSDGYEVWMMTECDTVSDPSEEMFYYQEGLVECFIERHYGNLRKENATIYIEDSEMQDVLIGEIEEWEEHFAVDDEPEDDGPDPDEYYDRMKDEGLLNK